jgi:hypothetical protein
MEGGIPKLEQSFLTTPFDYAQGEDAMIFRKVRKEKNEKLTQRFTEIHRDSQRRNSKVESVKIC